MCKFINLQPYGWDYYKLKPYLNDKIFIKGKNYKINNEPFYKIENLERIRYIDSQQLTDKYVYKLRNADNNNDEIYIKLTFCQNFIFYAFTVIPSKLYNFVKYIPSFILSNLKIIKDLWDCL